MHTYKIKKITKIIDGDTLDVEIDLGFFVTIKERIRLKDINAPEIRTLNIEEKSKGILAKEWLEKELSQNGEWVIQTFKEEKYGRTLGIIYLKGNSITVNEKMLNEGIVSPY